ncbi:phenylacetic acid degradation protein paaN [Burkholderia pseudomallei MSHR7498]|nr:phenylacetic acid degradation protein paaN [Burkholderia pseudomallei MSHR7498]
MRARTAQGGGGPRRAKARVAAARAAARPPAGSMPARCRAASACGRFAIILLSNRKPSSHVTPTPVGVGCGASPR